MNKTLAKINFPKELSKVIADCPGVIIPRDRNELIDLALGGKENSQFEVAYEVPGRGRVVEAVVSRCKNGVVINYPETYLRRRDPDCMVIADNEATEKQKFSDKYNYEFSTLRESTFDWLAEQKLIVLPFWAGGKTLSFPALLVAPENASFFVAGLADLQTFIPADEIEDNFTPQTILYVAPPFRHTHFEGKQMVVHNRLDNLYELFAYNLYPGPSAKKGVYGALIHLGEKEGWITAHSSTVMVVTPYENVLTIMHEGASGGGKSEMTEQLHRELDGRILLGKNILNNSKVMLEIKETCELRPVTDDMALCHPSIQNSNKKLVVTDAENGWFIRTDHIKKYGTDLYLEEACIHPKEPLIFLNYEAVPNSTCLLWEHIMDAPGKPCPNPRVILPRHFVSDIVNEPVEIDVRSFGVRTPPCTKENPSYGILGLFHILPPALAWLWRLVSPRGYDNPSVTNSDEMSSEGVGSYWPFATGQKVNQANLLLKQIIETSNTRYILIPNQHIGAYKVGFMPQWIAREYLARRGSARFNQQQLVESRCPLLGYSFDSLKVDGQYIPKEFLEVNQQSEIGDEGYDKGAEILAEFFRSNLELFATPDLYPLGRRIIECCFDNGSVDDYIQFIPMKN